VATAACLALSACTAHMDMTIRSQGSYDVALEMRDTTGTVFPKGKAPDCSTYSDPTAPGGPEGTTVKASNIRTAIHATKICARRTKGINGYTRYIGDRIKGSLSAAILYILLSNNRSRYRCI